MEILRRAGYRRMPWKNGQGLTEEVAAFPPDSAIDTFDWRLSIAHVGADGPFSLFPGVDRSIALLDGEGLVLDLPEGGSTLLEQAGAPFAFLGEWEVSSRNSGGGTIDLNIMTRRGRCAHRLARHAAGRGHTHSWPHPVALVANAELRFVVDGGTVALARFDCMMLSSDTRVVVEHGAGTFLSAEIWPSD